MRALSLTKSKTSAFQQSRSLNTPIDVYEKLSLFRYERRLIMSNEEKISIFQEVNKTSFEDPQQAVAEESEPGQSEPEENPEWTDTIETEPTDN